MRNWLASTPRSAARCPGCGVRPANGISEFKSVACVRRPSENLERTAQSTEVPYGSGNSRSGQFGDRHLEVRFCKRLAVRDEISLSEAGDDTASMGVGFVHGYTSGGLQRRALGSGRRCGSVRTRVSPRLKRSRVKASAGGTPTSAWSSIEILMNKGTNLFPVWVLLSAVIGVVAPQLVMWFRGGYVIWTLALIMLGMGLTLPLRQLAEAVRSPGKVILGAVAQFSIMPLIGYTIARALRLPEPFLIGVALVATCPGGTASNLVCLLCNANVALSVLMTTATTLMSVLATPLLLKYMIGKVIYIDAAALMVSTAQVVLLPLALGVAAQRFAPRAVSAVSSTLPFASVLGVSMICSSIVGANSQALLASGARLFLAVFLLHACGFLLGYLFGRFIARFSEQDSRTVSIEVGMQNSGLGAALAQLHFADPLCAVPAAISASTHSVVGSLLAAYWRNRDLSKDKDE